jgi:hypothetical protein
MIEVLDIENVELIFKLAKRHDIRVIKTYFPKESVI